MLFVPRKAGCLVCEYMHARAIYNGLTHGRTVQKGGSNPQSPGKSHPGMGLCSFIACISIVSQSFCRSLEEGHNSGDEVGVRMTA